MSTKKSQAKSTMLDTDLSFLTVPELIECQHMISEELELRFMETAGTEIYICEATGVECCGCRQVCVDRKVKEK